MAEKTANSIVQSCHTDGGKGLRVLLLQGPSSFFFRDLGLALASKGASVTRVAFTAGDSLYWSKRAGEVVWFRRGKSDYSDWIADLCRRQAITDVIMLGDGRFYHRVVAELIKNQQISARLHVIEHGLMRPGLILRDPDGLGGNSVIPERFSEFGGDNERTYGATVQAGSFVEYAVLDVVYHVVSLIAGPFVNPSYVRHSLDHPVWEYLGWLRKAVTRPARQAQRKAAERRIFQDTNAELFLFPLQLATDFQVRDHGVGEPMEATLARVINSFAAHASPGARLVVKRHPLDNGWLPWRRLILAQAQRLGVGGRVEYVEGGSLDALLDAAKGVVTINSTVGLAAILAGVPCCVLGTAVYDIDGLSFQGELDAFWQEPSNPDSKIANKFRDFLLSDYHVPGAFDGPGSKVGAENLAEWVCREDRV